MTISLKRLPGRLLTGVQVTVKVDDGDGSVSSVDRLQKGRRDGVITAKCDHMGQGFGLDRRTPLVRICCRGAREDVRPSSICPRTKVLLYDMTGMSPQSSTVAQLLKGLVLKGTS